MDRQEQYSRRSNIRIHGIEAKQGENVNEVVGDLLKNKLEMDFGLEAVDHSHRIGPTTGNRRSIIVKFTRYDFKKAVINARKRLKGSRIAITEDLTRTRHDTLQRVWEVYGKTDTWTVDGVIFHRDKNGKRLRFEVMGDLCK